MRVPLSWLKDYVDIDIDPLELADKLTSIGVPVENVEYISPDITNVKVGWIRDVRQHPNADKLRLCDVDLGEDGTLQIVTGASNVKKGDKVPVALHGARLAGDLRIKRSKIRGEESEGMMCSAVELGVDIKDLPQEQREGVMILPPDTPPGEDVTKLFCLNDPILVFEIFANRPDLLSVLGIARETAAVLGRTVKEPSLYFPEIEDKAIDHLDVKIENFELCKKYSGRIIRNVHICPSPLWMQGRLFAAGVRPINNVVDFTNYVMLEMGQPLHAFDYDRVNGKKIIVRNASAGEKLVTIDGRERELEPSVLVIADPIEPVAMAGVMGGLESEISENTKTILLESANFNPISIRRTSLKLGLRSESSRRFEKGIDYHMVELASLRACHFLAGAGGQVLMGQAMDTDEFPKPEGIFLRSFRVNEILGTDIHESTMLKLLANLGFIVYEKGGTYLVVPPTIRQDVKEEIDVVEEIARLYGYDNIPVTKPAGLALGGTDPDHAFSEYLRELAVRCGLYECITLSMYDKKTIEDYRINPEKLLRVVNPLTEDQEYLRSNAVSHLVNVVKKNIAMKNNVLHLFEIGKFYTMEEGNVQERRELTILLTGPEGTADISFFDLKGIVEYIFSNFRINAEFSRAEVSYLHPNKTASFKSGDTALGVIGVFHPRIAADLGIEQEIVIARIFIDPLQILSGSRQYRPIPRFPAVERDLAVIVDERTPAGDVHRIIIEKGRPLVEDAYCFDVYKGKQIPDGKKSLAFSVNFVDPERTLTDEEVQACISKILEELKKEVNAVLRG
jgi:phenylalanyl-tRNA synthetase beta chain